MRKPISGCLLFATVLTVVLSVAALAQSGSPLPRAVSRPQKQIDIGAAEAPLSDQERTELDSAVRKHNYAAEKALIDRAEKEHAGSWELLILAGRLAYLEKQPKDAADAFERADGIKPLAEDDRMTLALAQEFSGHPDTARATLIKLTKASPRNAQYFYLLGRLDVQNRHLEDAIVSFGKAIELNPNILRAYEEMGQAQENLGLDDAARKTYESGAARNRLVNGRWPWSPLDLGMAVMKNGDLDHAEDLFREALQYNPRFSWAHYYLGQLNQKKGRNAESLAEYKEAVVDDPTLRQAWLALGREFMRLGQKDEANKCLARFRELEERENARAERRPPAAADLPVTPASPTSPAR
jgi:tetratricopeptide (TPR) repeat protein